MDYDSLVVLDPHWNPRWELLKLKHLPPLIRPTLHRFSGGELHVQFPEPVTGRKCLLAHRLNSADHLLELLLAADAIRGSAPSVALDAFFPYIPYARQDRRMVPGDPLSLKVFANLINAQNFGRVFVLDPHSDVAPALLDRCSILPIDAFVAAALQSSKADFLVVPDAGAAKKAYALVQRLAGEFPALATVQAGKTRDVQHKGRITGMQLEGNPDLTGKTCLIVDDICDGGRTFLELSKLLRAHSAAKVYCYISHGIFAKGTEALLDVSAAEGRLDGLFTTDSIRSHPSTPSFVQYSL